MLLAFEIIVKEKLQLTKLKVIPVIIWNELFNLIFS